MFTFEEKSYFILVLGINAGISWTCPMWGVFLLLAGFALAIGIVIWQDILPVVIEQVKQAKGLAEGVILGLLGAGLDVLLTVDQFLESGAEMVDNAITLVESKAMQLNNWAFNLILTAFVPVLNFRYNAGAPARIQELKDQEARTRALWRLEILTQEANHASWKAKEDREFRDLNGFYTS